MRRHTVPLALAAVLAATTLTATSAAAAPPEPTKYLALGDSYPAGEPGVGTDLAYPALLAQRTPHTELDNMSASGATTTVVLGQIAAHAVATPDYDADVVTLTVGANDLDWVAVLTTCVTPTGCVAPTSLEVQAMAQRLGLDIISAAGANEGAEIYVTGYPLPFGPISEADPCTIGPAPAPYPDGTSLAVDADTAMAADGLVAQLNNAIATAVGVADALENVDATYVDASAYFEDHRLCDDSPWLYDLNDYPMSFHPTAGGQRAYAQAINEAGFRESVRPKVVAGRS